MVIKVAVSESKVGFFPSHLLVINRQTVYSIKGLWPKMEVTQFNSMHYVI